MKALNFEVGKVSYSLNDKIEVSFNPTDTEFIEKLYDTFDKLDREQEDYKAKIETLAEPKEIFAFIKEKDKEMRKLIDAIFDASVSDAVFGDMNVYAMAGGLPVWANLLFAIMDEIDGGFAREKKATSPRVEKYLEKYKK